MNSTTDFPPTKTAEHVSGINVKLQIKDARLLWVSCEVVLVFCTVISVYQMLCLALHGYREHRKYHHYPKSSIFLRSSMTSFLPGTQDVVKKTLKVDDHPVDNRSPKEKSYQLWMIGLAISATGISFTKFLADQLKFTYAWNARSNLVCEVLNDVTEIGLYGSVAVCTYGFLWLKQWIFYHNPAVSEMLYRDGLIKFSKSLPVGIMIISLIVVVTNIVPLRYCYDVTVGTDYVGCIAIYDVNKPSDAWPIFLYISVTSTFQISLLILFLYPLLRRQIDTCKNKKNHSFVQAFNSENPHNVRKHSSLTSERLYSTSTCLFTPPSSATLPTSPAKMDSKFDAQLTEVCATKEYLTTNNIKGSEQVDTNKNQISKLKTDQSKSISSTPPNSPMYQKNSPKTTPRLIRKNINHHKPSIASLNNIFRSEGLKKKKEKSKAMNSVSRASVWTALCIGTDVTVVGISLWLGPGAPLILITTMNNVNIIVNQFCVIATFSKWKDILFPIFRKKKNDIGPTSRFKGRESCTNSRRGTIVSHL